MIKLLRTNEFILKRFIPVHLVSVVFLFIPIIKKITDSKNDVTQIYNYESTFTTVLLVLILMIGLFMYKMIDSKLLCLEIICHGSQEVFTSLFILIEMYCSIIVMLFYFLYSFCFGCLDVFFRYFFVIFVVYFVIIGVIFCIGFILNNYILSSFVSWLLFCAIIITYYITKTMWIRGLYPMMWLNYCSNEAVQIEDFILYFLFSGGIMIILYALTKKCIQTKEFK